MMNCSISVVKGKWCSVTACGKNASPHFESFTLYKVSARAAASPNTLWDQRIFPESPPFPPPMGLTPAVKEVEPEEKSKDSLWAGFTIICFLKWAKQFFWLMFCFVSCLTGSRMPRSPQSPLIMTSLQVGARSPTQTDSWEDSCSDTPEPWWRHSCHSPRPSW